MGVVLFGFCFFPCRTFLVRLEVIGAERFLYLPSIGYCIALGLLLRRFGEAKDRAINRVIGSVCLCGRLVCGIRHAHLSARSQVWQTEDSFWKRTVQDAPRSPRSWNGMGSVLMSQKKYDEAIEDLNKALGLNPMLLDADYNMATCFFLKGD